jgi:hypothetical protein
MDPNNFDEYLSEDDPRYQAELEEKHALAKRYNKRPDMSWRDHLVMLLSFGAAAEHCLMVQYLYAAYSLKTEGEDPDRRKKIEDWRAHVLAVAREEMGHLLTVQNLLLLLGAPASLGRENSVWAEQYYPYPFSLEPLTLETLACFIYAEMPAHAHSEEINEIKKRLETLDHLKAFWGGGPPDMHRVGKLYDDIISLVSNPKLIPDSAFDDSSFEFQASWDEWGRGYKPKPHDLDAAGNPAEPDPRAGQVRRLTKTLADSAPPPADSDVYVRIDRMATRTDAVKALVALAAQGEAPHILDASHLSIELRSRKKLGERSHFDRFLHIYRELLKETNKSNTTPRWSPSHGVCSNPTTRTIPKADDRGAVTDAGAPQSAPPIKHSVVDAVVAKHLAEVFNQRYRLLLNYLAHCFRLAGRHRVDRPNLRAMLMHRVFGEMYNLKTLAGLLVRSPRRDPGHKDDRGEWAAPPFEMPYSLALPDADVDVWRQHDDLLETSQHTCYRLLHYGSMEQPSVTEKQHREHAHRIEAELAALGAEAYLRTLMELDVEARRWIRAIVHGEA